VQSFRDYSLRASTKTALEAQDITAPTPIQAEAIPLLLEGRDVIAQACTGSGKTLAFGVPLVELIDPEVRQLQALVLCPTRELAQQVGGVLSQLLESTKMRSTVVFGGRAIGPQIDALKRAQIVVGTPGRILDHMERGSMSVRGVRYIVLDEADEMLDRGFAPDVQRILSLCPEPRQTALFSATTPEWVHQVSRKYLDEPAVIAIEPDEDNAPAIDHVVYEVWSGDKLPVLCSLLDQRTEGATLVFRRTKRGVRNLSAKLRKLGYHVDELQGDLNQQQRDKVLRKFRDGSTPVLVATNVAARGLDILHIERVINYELPDTFELFTHRVGRTGRMGRSGLAITLLGADDLSKWHEIERGLGRKFPRMTADGKVVTPPPEPRRARGFGRSRRTLTRSFAGR
jgi:ATP-dependent RNA helicase DeaD